MANSTMDMGSLSLLVFVVIISCCLGTLLAWWWMRSILPPTYQYCAACAHQLGVLPPDQAVVTDGVVARPVQGQAGTFQRLGMKTTRPGMGLEVGHLETRPLSPTPAEEVDEKSDKKKSSKGNEMTRKDVKQYMISPGSAEVMARKNTVQSFPTEYRMSRRTLVFPSQSHNSSVLGLSTEGEVENHKKSSSGSSPYTVVDAEEDEVQVNKVGDIKQRQVVRRSVSARKEKSKLSLLRRQEDAGLTSQSEDERGCLALRQSRRHSRAASKAGSDKAVVVDGLDNPGYVATSDTQEGVSGPGYQNLPNIHFSPRRS